MTTTTAAVVETGGAEFTLSEVELTDPQPDEIRVRLVAAGLCHTDLGVASGALPFPLPGVLGHEGAGIVEAVGTNVSTVDVGDHVLLSFTSCGSCGNCRDGHPAYCATWLPLNLIGGARADGTSPVSRGGEAIGGHFFGQSSFAHHAVVDARSAVKVDPDAPLDLLAPLGCGVQTGVGAVWNVLNPRPGQTVLITGAGAVGLSAVMAAALTPASKVIVVDRVPERLELARELGATHVINAAEVDTAEELTKITAGAGVDGAVETTGNVGVLRTAIDALAPRGTAVIVGAPAFGTEVPVDVNAMIPGRSIVGLTLGDSETQTLIPVLVDLVRSGRLPIDRLITHYAFDDINTAVADMVAGTSIKPVLRF
ncbi:NAD(P)-dependent alcohol dehydrogenase [Rhodococcus opacus]|uniref:NAD(P)-dependent alcohol dehydrogenase n=1 Tax=Rhodococcus opacus TaxID=37919 RepID=A0AAX3YRF4_RHOOP|nr:NAD(P)-dependent alcohol dehydrogenase [Rhodococcus opacus]MCZ4587553.1 NAD(P)-dependent alcohol dehydrogenase [Rhodococcus opacus]WLF51445.1 NAD(P)-dependent alcohol dehydrogenase [Rhodococcus opacus]